MSKIVAGQLRQVTMASTGRRGDIYLVLSYCGDVGVSPDCWTVIIDGVELVWSEGLILKDDVVSEPPEL